MDYIRLHNTEIDIPKLSLGTWAFSDFGTWGPNDEKDSIDTIHAALDKGITLLDTAERYGGGKSEEILGKALKGRRDKAIVATKVYSDALRYDDVLAHCEESLKRLDTDYIDLYQIHWPNKDVPAEETFRAFEDLKKAGKIRAVGVCNYAQKGLEEIRGLGAVTNQLPYSLIWRQVEDGIIQKTTENHMVVWAYSPLAQGLLGGKYLTLDDVPAGRRGTRFYNGQHEGGHGDPGFEGVIFPFLNELDAVCKETGYPMATLAIAFLKKNAGSILVGARNVSQIERNIAAYDTDVPDELVARITKLSEPVKKATAGDADLWSGNGGRMY